MGIARRKLNQHAAALADHAKAVDIFLRNHDDVARGNALDEFYLTMRATRGGPIRARLVRHAIGRL
jgi:hypothetical protein